MNDTRTATQAPAVTFADIEAAAGLLAGRVFWFYLGKLVWPAELMFFYPRWTIDGSAAWQYLFPAAGLGLLAALIWWTRWRHERGPLAAFLVFGGTLVPVLGFVNVYPFVFSYVADHFQYLASISIFALVAAAGTRAIKDARFGRSWRGAPAVCAVVLILLAALTWPATEPAPSRSPSPVPSPGRT